MVLRWLHILSGPSHPAGETERWVTCCGELAELARITPSNVRDALQRLSDADVIALQIGVHGDPYLVEVCIAAQLELGPPDALAKLPALTQRSIIDVLAGQITERI